MKGIIKKVAALGLSAAMVIGNGFIATPVQAAEGVPIDEAHFPDEEFRSYVSNSCDKDSNGALSNDEIVEVKEIGLSWGDISSLKGVEYFTELEDLFCVGMQKMTVLDVSKNVKLKDLCVDSCQLTALDISHNTVLEQLYCAGNQITTLDVTQNVALQSLYCYGNQLTTLDVSKNTKLWELLCDNNQLTVLDISHNPALRNIRCEGNNFEQIDVSAISDLDNLRHDGDLNKEQRIITYTKSDPQNEPNDGNTNDEDILINEIDHSGNPVVALDEEHFPDSQFREYLKIQFDRVSDKYVEESHEYVVNDPGDGVLTTNEIAAIKEVRVGKVATFKGIEYLTKLDVLISEDCALSSIDLSHNTKLTWVILDNCGLSSIDVSKNREIMNLSVNDNSLASIDISQNTKLERLFVEGNKLCSLNLTKNTKLTDVHCKNNPSLKTVYLNKDAKLITENQYWDRVSGVYMDYESPTKIVFEGSSPQKANTLKVTSKTATVKYSKLKKKNQTVGVSSVLTVKNAKGKVTYAKASGNKKISINKTTGKVTIKKGLKKGTYSVKAKVTAAGNSDYKAAAKTVTFKIKVK